MKKTFVTLFVFIAVIFVATSWCDSENLRTEYISVKVCDGGSYYKFLSGVYKKRDIDHDGAPYYEKQLEENGTQINREGNNECGCKCSDLTYVDEDDGTTQGKCSVEWSPGNMHGKLWCFVESSFTGCDDLVPSWRFPYNNPWSFQACSNPVSATNKCVRNLNYSVLYRDGDYEWTLTKMMDQKDAIIFKSRSAEFPKNLNFWSDIIDPELGVEISISNEIDNHHCGKTNPEVHQHISIIIGTLIILLLICLIIIIGFLLRNKKKQEKVIVDHNYYYGKDSDMLSINDHRVVDMNPYYE